MKIYTRTGDKGETSLFTGQRVLKNDPTMDALGTIDETTCAIGVALASLPGEMTDIKEQLNTIQHTLFDLGAALATPRTRAGANKIEKTRFDHEGIEALEKWIDILETHLPPLQTFILPGGHISGAYLHLARSICRRAERLIVPLYLHSDVSEHVLIYINRLSDYLFVCSRYVNHLCNSPETTWIQRKSS